MELFYCYLCLGLMIATFFSLFESKRVLTPQEVALVTTAWPIVLYFYSYRIIQ